MEKIWEVGGYWWERSLFRTNRGAAGSTATEEGQAAAIASKKAARRRSQLSPSRIACSLPTVGIFQSHHVIELGGRHLDDVYVRDRYHAMDGVGRTVKHVARPHAQHAKLCAAAHLEIHFAALDQKCLVLLDVVLARQLLPGLDVENLADVAVGLCPHELVAPRLVHASHPSVI